MVFWPRDFALLPIIESLSFSLRCPKRVRALVSPSVKSSDNEFIVVTRRKSRGKMQYRGRFTLFPFTFLVSQFSFSFHCLFILPLSRLFFALFACATLLEFSYPLAIFLSWSATHSHSLILLVDSLPLPPFSLGAR